MIVKPLSLNEAGHHGWTHFVRITADDLTNTTNAAAQTLTLLVLSAGDIMKEIEDNVIVPFGVHAAGVLDTAFNTTTRSLGDTSLVTTWTAAAEANPNGTVIAKTWKVNTTVAPYTAANTVTLTFNSMAAKNLNSINRGELHVFIKIGRVSGLSAGGAGMITTAKT